MANGIIPAAPLVPASFGLLSVADVTTTSNTAEWVRGFAVEFNSRPQEVRILTQAEGIVENGTVYEAEGDQKTQYEDIDPFFIEATLKTSGMAYGAIDRRAQLATQLDTVTDKAVEFELWTGVGAIADDSDQSYLMKDGGATVIGSGGVSPRKALSLIEGAIANSPTGAGGVIHVTRDVASILTLQGSIKPVDSANGGQHLETVLGTKVAVGSGYTGDGPGTTNGASDTVKWIYATGAVSVLLGEVEIVNEDTARSFTAPTNDVNLSAIRAAAVYFDPSIFYGVQIAIPDAP